jgi:hypothetical protein
MEFVTSEPLRLDLFAILIICPTGALIVIPRLPIDDHIRDDYLGNRKLFVVGDRLSL